MSSVYPENFELFNEYSTKRLNVVVCIEGLDFCFGLMPTYTKIRYGDPDTYYGDAGLVYGGLRLIDGIKPWLSTESSLMLSQKLEPEQGRGSVSTLGLVFIDKDGYFSQLAAPGQVLDELLGSKKVTVKLGYVNTSYPDDYFTVFRGYISRVRLTPTKVAMDLSDANLKRRQFVFFSAKTKLTAPITNVALAIPVQKTDRFFNHQLGPDGLYDSSARTFLKIDDELIEYGPGALSPTSVAALTRGSLGTTAAAHATGAEVQTVLQLEGNVMDLALKIMLSNWAGNWIDSIPVASIGQTTDLSLGVISNTFLLNQDAVDTLGLAIGDYFTISGSGLGNNFTGIITGIGDANDFSNRLIYTDQTFTTESPATGVTVAFRSQFDTLPTECGLKMKPVDVDVAQHVAVKTNFLSQAENTFRFLLSDQESGKDFIEKQLFLPTGVYSLTRFGRISCVTTKPPIADSGLVFLNASNIIEPQNIAVERALTTRRFFNEIQYFFDERQLEKDTFSSVEYILDSDSLVKLDQSSALPISSRGMRSDLSANVLIDRRGNFLLSRYKDAAYEITMKVNWSVGALIEAGDVVAVQDNGELKIPNLSTGERDLQTALFEVIERNMDIKTGQVQLKLLSNVGYTLNDRFATISPSTILGAGNTTTRLQLTPSYGQLFGADEWKKWIDYIGLPVLLHDYAWTYAHESTIIGFDAVNPNIMIVSPAFPIVPLSGDIIDIARYPDTTEPLDNQTYKIIHSFITPTLTVVSGTSSTVFDVSLADAAKVVVGLPVMIHNADYSIESDEAIVASVVGTTITLETALSFTPSAGQLVELVGYKDGGGPYRII